MPSHRGGEDGDFTEIAERPGFPLLVLELRDGIAVHRDSFLTSNVAVIKQELEALDVPTRHLLP
jgi:hypothetical protein